MNYVGMLKALASKGHVHAFAAAIEIVCAAEKNVVLVVDGFDELYGALPSLAAISSSHL
jgi:hypothetical protein